MHWLQKYPVSRVYDFLYRIFIIYIYISLLLAILSSFNFKKSETYQSTIFARIKGEALQKFLENNLNFDEIKFFQTRILAYNAR